MIERKRGMGTGLVALALGAMPVQSEPVPDPFSGTATMATSEIGENDFRISEMGPNGNPSYHGLKPAIAYNPDANEYLVVWWGSDDSGALAVNEVEIWGQRLDASTGAEVGDDDFRISDMGPDGDGSYGAFDPAVAYNALAGEYLVIWRGDDDTGVLADDEFEIFGQRLDAVTGAEIGVNDFQISEMGQVGNSVSDADEADVAFNPTHNEYLVVWEGNDSNGRWDQIYAQRLDGTTGQEIGTDDFRITNSGMVGGAPGGCHDPAVVYNPVQDQYLVVWSGRDHGAPGVADGEREIFGQRLSGVNATQLGADDFLISTMGPSGDDSFTFFAMRPDVAHNPVANEYFVVWEGDEFPFTFEVHVEIYGQRLHGATGAELGIDDIVLSDSLRLQSRSNDHRHPAVAFNPAGNEYLVAWEGCNGGNTDCFGPFEIYGQRADGTTGTPFGVSDERLSDVGPDGATGPDGVWAAVAHNPADGEFVVTWNGNDIGGAGPPIVNQENEIYGQRLIEVLFHNGFETGDLSGWDETEP